MKFFHPTLRVVFVLVAGLFVSWPLLRLGRQPATATLKPVLQQDANPDSTSQNRCFGEQGPWINVTGIPSFVDVTNEWNLQFQHVVGPLGTYFMPESVGTGGALFDYDGDGRLDLFLVQSDRSPRATGDWPPGTKLGSRLFRQTERGTFEDQTQFSGLAGSGYGVGCAVGDVDNDGDLDLYVTRYAQDNLYLNNADGTFRDITDVSGIKEDDWGTCAAFFDYNRDGRLDLIVINYACDTRFGHSLACGYAHGVSSYCGPHKFYPTVDRLYRNDGVQLDSGGNGYVKFTESTQAAGLGMAKTNGFGVSCVDVNVDGWPDIYVANDAGENRLWINRQDGTFVEEAMQRGCAVNCDGLREANMGIAVGDVDHDGQFDFLVTHLSTESASLFLARENGTFDYASRTAGIMKPTSRHTGWGTALIDLNHDGELDCAVANGLIVACRTGVAQPHDDQPFNRHDVIEDPQAYWRAFADQNVLMMGQGKGTFQNATDQGGDFCASVGSARALIHGDIDNDGDLDIVVTNCGGQAKLYRNDFSKAGDWLMVRAFDPALHRDAIGAEVTLRAGEKSYHAMVNPASSFLASNDVRVHFGLGKCESFDEIVVKWPDGPIESAVEVFDGGATNRLMIIHRGSGRASSKNR